MSSRILGALVDSLETRLNAGESVEEAIGNAGADAVRFGLTMKSATRTILSQAELYISADEIAERVGQLAFQITNANTRPERRSLTVVSVMSGAMVFTADLIRKLEIPNVKLNLVSVKSYVGKQSTDPEVTWLSNADIAGNHVLLVDDILDTGKTIALLEQQILDMGAKSVETAVLLRKHGKGKASDTMPVKYVGFDIEDDFVVGYGLDCDGRDRHRPDIWRMID